MKSTKSSLYNRLMLLIKMESWVIISTCFTHNTAQKYSLENNVNAQFNSRPLSFQIVGFYSTVDEPQIVTNLKKGVLNAFNLSPRLLGQGPKIPADGDVVVRRAMEVRALNYFFFWKSVPLY